MASEESVRGLRVWVVFLNLAALQGVVIGKPLYDVFGEHPDFFVVNRVSGFGIVMFLAVVSLVIPLALTGVVWLVGRSHLAVGRVLLGALVGVYVTGYFVYLGKGMEFLPPIVCVLAGIVGGVCVGVLYSKRKEVSAILSIVSPMAVLFPVMFLLNGDMQRVMSPPDVSSLLEGDVGVQWIEKRPPIFFILMDEFPLATILTAEGKIDAEHYPNFAGLAERATWYENGTTVNPNTIRSVTSMLTGNRASLGKIVPPTYEYFPRNLFTLLGRHYDFHVVEDVTNFNPMSYEQVEGAASGARMGVFADDVMIVLVHVLLPEPYTRWVPEIGQQWGAFRNRGAATELEESEPDSSEPLLEDNPEEREQRIELAFELDRVEKFRMWVDEIEGYPESTLHFLHIMLPHPPFLYMPSGAQHSGQTYVYGAHLNNPNWSGTPQAMLRVQQGLRIQTAAMDTLLGEFVLELERLELFDDSLIVLVADHGVAYLSQKGHRTPTRETFGDIAFIPLMIKYPGQVDGEVDSSNVETIDLVPTVHDVVGADSDWVFEGRSLLDESAEVRSTKRMLEREGAAIELTREEYLAAKEVSIQRFVERFSIGEPGADLFHFGNHLDMIDKPVTNLREHIVEGTFNLWGFGDIVIVPEDAPYVPSRVIGEVRTPHKNPGELYVAIVIGSRIEQLVQPHAFEGKHWFDAMIEEGLIGRGQNRVDLFLVDLDGATKPE